MMQSHFQGPLLGSFEYVPYTAFTIVCTINVSIDCKKNKVSNPNERENILDIFLFLIIGQKITHCCNYPFVPMSPKKYASSVFNVVGRSRKNAGRMNSGCEESISGIKNDFFPTLSNSAFETEFGSVHNGLPFQPQWSESKYTDMNRKMLSL